MFASKVSRLNDKLTYSEKKIAKLILENSDKIDSMTSEQIAHEAGCAQATVSRFAQKLGYSSFKNMLLDVSNSSLLHKNSELQNRESPRDTMFKLKNLYIASLDDAIENNSDTVIDKAVEYIEQADTVFCFGVRASFAMISVMYYRLLELGLRTSSATTTIEGVSIARNLKKDDVVLVVSVSGETNEVVAVAQAAKASGAKVISIVGSSGSTLELYSDVTLKSAEFNVHTKRVNLVNRTPALFLIDTLFMRLWQQHEEVYIQSIENFQKQLSEQGFQLNAAGEPDGFRI